MRVLSWGRVLGGALVITVAGHAGAYADNVTVDCSGSTPGAPTSINAALAPLSLTGPHTITVIGTCHESVSVSRRDRVTIQGPVGGTATIAGGASGPAV